MVPKVHKHTTKIYFLLLCFPNIDGACDPVIFLRRFYSYSFEMSIYLEHLKSILFQHKQFLNMSNLLEQSLRC